MAGSKLKVLLVQRYIPHYRIKIFEMLSQYVDLTIMYSQESIQGQKDYSRLKIQKVDLFKIPKIGYFHRCNFLNIANRYDVVMVPVDSSLQSVQMLRRNKKRKCKVVSWGIGVLADREHAYDSSDCNDAEFLRNIRQSDSAVFYSDYPVLKYTKLGIEKEKLFVAQNTVWLDKHPFCAESKDSILFLGSLYQVKKVDELVRNYWRAWQECENLPNLYIIGDGEMKRSLERQIAELNLSSKVELVGEITEDEKLFPYFQRALACISPNQAGLSVLQSMGYGVPVVTSKDSITGGEIFSIISGENGVLFDKMDDLKEILADISNHTSKYMEMGKKAYQFYWEKRTPEIMVKGFLDAIQYAVK